jgi:Cft2 family RNA processing exonuclease
LALTVRQSKGVIVEYGEDGIALDPDRKGTDHPIFVTHAHGDHASSFKNPESVKHATEATYRLLEALQWKKLNNWKQVTIGDKVKIGEMEVRPLNAGHVLGSVQYEVSTPEGTVLYTGDISMGNSYTMEPARAVNCDLLIIETTFGAPQFKFPPRKEVALEMIRWAVMEAIPAGYVPAFRCDAIGNAQEIISIFNRMTNLPVVTAKNATKVSDVYRQFGHKLDYVDSNTQEGQELLESGRCVVIAPKGAKLGIENLDPALASGWAAIMRNRAKAFPLSDHADFRELLSFIRRCRPKRVLTFHGGKMTRGFAEYVKKRLGIDAGPLTKRRETLMGPVSNWETRRKACAEHIVRAVRIPGFVYTEPWMVREMARRGFSKGETEAALRHLVDVGVLEPTSTGVMLS